ncbi:hypothetical protein GCM10023321_73190 [Pseudonocardia eucalypti]|uniref:Uncharacterized protein n=1 Tax=Pseudonocardia eucalypti TaxID=648755 RepID=A0ABP9R8R2_9PSEU
MPRKRALPTACRKSQPSMTSPSMLSVRCTSPACRKAPLTSRHHSPAPTRPPCVAPHFTSGADVTSRTPPACTAVTANTARLTASNARTAPVGRITTNAVPNVFM